MEIAIIILLSIVLILEVVMFFVKQKNSGTLTEGDLNKINKVIDERLKNQRELLEEKNKSFIEQVSLKLEHINSKLDSFTSRAFEQFNSMNNSLINQNKDNNKLFNEMVDKVITMSNDIKEKLSIELKDFSKSLDQDFERLEKGLSTELGEKGIRMSGGERQRVALARLFFDNSKIVILDEATSSVDTRTEKKIQDAMVKLMKNL